MGPKEKKRFEEMAEKDKERYERELAQFATVNPGLVRGRKRKRTKDPNAPKRALYVFIA